MVEVIEMNKWYFVCSLLIVVIVAESVAFLNVNNMYVTLSSEYDLLKEEHQALTVAYDNLSQNYCSLETNYTNLELQYNILQIDFATLQLNYSNLEANYATIKTENGELKAKYHNLSVQFTELAENYTVLESQYAQLTENYTILETRFIDLKANYTVLHMLYESLQANYTNLQTQYDTLWSNYTTLLGDYNELQTTYTSLQSNYTILEEDYNTLEAQYNSLQTLYENLQAEYDRYAAAYLELRSKISQRWNEQNIEPFITPLDLFVNATVFDITGGWSNTSDWNEYWDDTKAMYNWVVDNIEYRSDGLFPILPVDPSGETYYGSEMWQFPNETLDLGKGDCEDMAILLCSMISCYSNMEYHVECIGIVSFTGGHLAVQVPVGDNKLVIFDPAGKYYSSDWLGDIVFNDISTEINNWLDYWKPEMGEDVYVNLVFSDYIHETFTSTSEYITWMYSR